MLRIGRIAYANCTPIFSALLKRHSSAAYHFFSGVPAQLNGMLAAGTIDVCPSSSFEYALHPERYLILPNLSISSTGAVGSVLLFSKRPLKELSNCKILLSSESATSVNLLKILLEKHVGIPCTYGLHKATFADAFQDASALLLIGDSALRESLRETGLHVYDLGQLWFDWTGLPFVFALWLCRRSSVDEQHDEVLSLVGQLKESKIEALANLPAIAHESSDVVWMGEERLIAYWRENISYDLDNTHVLGLKLFYRHCAELGLLPCEPALHFFDDSIRKDR